MQVNQSSIGNNGAIIMQIQSLNSKAREISEKLNEKPETISDHVDKLSKSFDTINQQSANLVKKINGNFAGIKISPQGLQAFQGAMSQIQNVVNGLNLVSAIKDFGEMSKAVAGDVKAFAEDTKAMLEHIKSFNTLTAAKKVASVVENAANGIKNLSIGINTALGVSEDSALGPIILIIAAVALLAVGFVLLFNKCKPFHDFVMSSIANIKNVFISVFNTINDYVTNTIANIKQIFNGIIEFFTGVFTGNWKKAFQGIRDIVGGIFGEIVNVVKTPINLIIDLINGLIGNMNNIIKAAANITGIGGIFKGVQIPKIPKLAQGGIIDSPMLAMIGEAGREAVVPLENNTGWIANLAANINKENGGGDTYLQTTIVLDSGEIISRQTKKLNRLGRNNNKPILSY
jgi:hypothetical protein